MKRLLLAGLTVAGCAHTGGVALNARLDEAASEVAIAQSLDLVDRGSARRFRAAIADAVPNTAGKPARFRARVFTDRTYWSLFPCVMGLALVGCPLWAEATRVELIVEHNGVRYRGKGRWSSLVTLYQAIGRTPDAQAAHVGAAARDALNHLVVEPTAKASR